jgi:hypothetical protein
MTYIAKAVEAGYINEDMETAPEDTYVWCADIVSKHPFFRQVYMIQPDRKIDFFFITFCIIEVQTGRWGDPATIMPGINSTNGDEK